MPYKYDLTKFVNVGSISVDHIDPSIFCVITAPSRDPAAPLADFLIFSPRWDVASHSKYNVEFNERRRRLTADLAYRPPYYHRNGASELMGLIYGEYAGRSDEFQPGGVSYECGFVPHGVAYEEVSPEHHRYDSKLTAQKFKAASAQPPPEMQISKGAIAFMMESSRMFTITDWAWNSKKKHEHDPKMWYVYDLLRAILTGTNGCRDNLIDNFSKHKDEVDKILSEGVKKVNLNGQ